MHPLFELPTDSVEVTADDCYTPRWVFDAMGLEFDLDVAAPPGGPLHVPARRWYTAAEDGLSQPWEGLVWCNPPYSSFGPWGRKWTCHDRGALMGAYAPETLWFPPVIAAAEAVAFISCKFIRPGAEPVKPRHGVFVAFRGVGTGPAERLAAADRFGAVLYGPNRGAA
jgi:hypothetical protein